MKLSCLKNQDLFVSSSDLPSFFSSVLFARKALHYLYSHHPSCCISLTDPTLMPTYSRCVLKILTVLSLFALSHSTSSKRCCSHKITFPCHLRIVTNYSTFSSITTHLPNRSVQKTSESSTHKLYSFYSTNDLFIPPVTIRNNIPNTCIQTGVTDGSRSRLYNEIELYQCVLNSFKLQQERVWLAQQKHFSFAAKKFVIIVKKSLN